MANPDIMWNDLFARASNLEINGFPRAAMDVVWNELDDLALENNFTTIDDAVKYASKIKLSENLMVAILSVTLQHKNSLPSRGIYFKIVATRLIFQNQDWREILKGLE